MARPARTSVRAVFGWAMPLMYAFSPSDGETFAIWEVANGIRTQDEGPPGRVRGSKRVNVSERRMRCSAFRPDFYPGKNKKLVNKW